MYGSPTIQQLSQPDIKLSQVNERKVREKQTIHLEQAKQPYERKKKWIKKKNFYRFLFRLIPVTEVTVKILGTSIFLHFQHKALRNFLGLKLNAKSGLQNLCLCSFTILWKIPSTFRKYSCFFRLSFYCFQTVQFDIFSHSLAVTCGKF